MYESHNNLLWANQVYSNKHHGIRFRNSKNTRIVDNVILNNERYGIYGHIKDLSYQGYRDTKLDPYEQHSSALVSGGLIGLNLSGAIYANSTDFLRLQRIRLERNGGGNQPLRGALAPWNGKILSTIRNHEDQQIVVSLPLHEADNKPVNATPAAANDAEGKTVCGGVICG